MNPEYGAPQKRFKSSLTRVVPSVNTADEPVMSFFRIGKKLSETERMNQIEERIDVQVWDNIQASDAGCFSYVEGSSGLGKTQLAFSFHRKVLYLPLGNTQKIYQHFAPMANVIKVAAIEDISLLRNRGHSTLSTNLLGGFAAPLQCVGLLLAVLENLRANTGATISCDTISCETGLFLGGSITLVERTVGEGNVIIAGWKEDHKNIPKIFY